MHVYFSKLMLQFWTVVRYMYMWLPNLISGLLFLFRKNFPEGYASVCALQKVSSLQQNTLYETRHDLPIRLRVMVRVSVNPKPIVTVVHPECTGSQLHCPSCTHMEGFFTKPKNSLLLIFAPTLPCSSTHCHRKQTLEYHSNP